MLSIHDRHFFKFGMNTLFNATNICNIFLMFMFLVAGLMSCSSACPCLYCPTRKVKGEWPAEMVTELRTVGSIKQSCESG